MKFKEGKIIDKFTVEKNEKKVPVIIRFLKKSDAKGLVSLLNPLVEEGAFLNRNKKIKLSEKKKITSEHVQNAKKNRGVSIVLESDKKIIGSAGGTRGKGAHSHTVDIGIAFAKEFRGLGLGKEVMKLLIGLAKKNLHSEIMALRCYDKNKTALNLYRKLGFIEIGRIKKGLKLNGKYYDEVIMVKYL